LGDAGAIAFLAAMAAAAAIKTVAATAMVVELGCSEKPSAIDEDIGEPIGAEIEMKSFPLKARNLLFACNLPRGHQQKPTGFDGSLCC